MYLLFGVDDKYGNLVSNIELSPILGIQDITDWALEEPECYYLGNCPNK